ncbi:hypothetical protein HZC30_00150 [Candidatus Woesearchaeota archaeon]|nr:hypothetical protein [Candidatus Woesearchaeota archaeon]
MSSENLGEYLTEILMGKFYSETEEQLCSRSSSIEDGLSRFVNDLWGLRVNLRLYTRVLETITGEKVPKPLPSLYRVSLEKMVGVCAGLNLDLLRTNLPGKKKVETKVNYKKELQPEVDLLRKVSWGDMEKAIEDYLSKIDGTLPKGLYVGESGLLYPAKIEVSPHLFGKMYFHEPEEEANSLSKPRLTLLGYELKKDGSPLEAACTYVNGPYTLDELEGVEKELSKSKHPNPFQGGGLPAGMIDWVELLVLINKIKDSPDNHLFVVGERQGADSYYTHRPVVEFRLLK